MPHRIHSPIRPQLPQDFYSLPLDSSDAFRNVERNITRAIREANTSMLYDRLSIAIREIESGIGSKYYSYFYAYAICELVNWRRQTYNPVVYQRFHDTDPDRWMRAEERAKYGECMSIIEGLVRSNSDLREPREVDKFLYLLLKTDLMDSYIVTLE